VPEKTADILIIGGGIAGLSMAAALDMKGMPFVLCASPSTEPASAVAAGLINPVTGRRYTLQTRYEQLMASAKEVYAHLAGVSGKSILEAINITRLHRSAEAREAFDALTDIPNAYLNTNAPLHAGQVHTEYGGMQVLNGFRVDVSALSGNLAMLHFQHGTVQHFVLDFPISFSQERYHTALGSFHTIIDCRGYQTAFDQSWQFIPFRQNKGEVLRVKITDPPSAGVYIKDCILVPLQDGTWWAGAHNSWTDHSPFPTTAGKESLENALNKLLSSSYKILDHQAAFRPAIRDRAPVVGRHPHLQRYYLLNGLGTKGYSLAPYHALMLADHILNEKPIDPKVDVARFY